MAACRHSAGLSYICLHFHHSRSHKRALKRSSATRSTVGEFAVPYRVPVKVGNYGECEVVGGATVEFLRRLSNPGRFPGSQALIRSVAGSRIAERVLSWTEEIC